MPTFDFTFTVRAPLAAVADFHRDTNALRLLTPPPMRVQMHRIEPLAEGSVSDFTLWLGPLPIRWTARHTEVSPMSGFTDTQIHGPMKRWVHSHRFFEAPGEGSRIVEHIDYEHFRGKSGVLSRLLFTSFGLWMTFCYRRFATRRLLERSSQRRQLGSRNA